MTLSTSKPANKAAKPKGSTIPVGKPSESKKATKSSAFQIAEIDTHETIAVMTMRT